MRHDDPARTCPDAARSPARAGQRRAGAAGCGRGRVPGADHRPAAAGPQSPPPRGRPAGPADAAGRAARPAAAPGDQPGRAEQGLGRASAPRPRRRPGVGGRPGRGGDARAAPRRRLPVRRLARRHRRPAGRDPGRVPGRAARPGPRRPGPRAAGIAAVLGGVAGRAETRLRQRRLGVTPPRPGQLRRRAGAAVGPPGLRAGRRGPRQESSPRPRRS